MLKKIVLIILCFSLLGCSTVKNVDNSAPPSKYITATHYFANEWPVNFWSSELDTIEVDFEQIKADGFNTIILAVPWKEFQPDITKSEYNSYPVEKLNFIFQNAQKHNLKVMLRVGYTWDYYNDAEENPIYRYYKMLYDEQMYSAWLNYVEYIYNCAKQYDNFAGGFICWEDFWNSIEILKRPAKQDDASQLAKKVGYQAYLQKTHKLQDINSLYQENFQSYDEIYIPSAESPAFRFLYEFYDEWLNTLLARTQTAFPKISMEIRIDDDLVKTLDNKSEYYNHSKTWNCNGADFVATVYGIPMGFENKGELVSSNAAVAMTNNILDRLNNVTNNKNLFIDQFLFSDNSVGFSHNAQIMNNEINMYLDKISATLAKKTIGYGVWTYKDYYTNMVYNPQFGLDLMGWHTFGNISVAKIAGSNMAHMLPGTTLSQKIPFSRQIIRNNDITCAFKINTDSDGQIKVKLGNVEQVIPIVKSKQFYEITFAKSQELDLEITSNVELYIDDVKLYSHIQKGNLYDSNGNESQSIDAIRKLNKALTESN